LSGKGSGHDYLPFDGLKEFVAATAAFAFGAESELIKSKKVPLPRSCVLARDPWPHLLTRAHATK